MTPERWEQLDRIFEAALHRAPSERPAFLDEACAGDQALRSEVGSLLDSHERASSFLEKPAIEDHAALFAEQVAQLQAGNSISHYQIIEQIGAGGMGEIYLAGDTSLGRKVALKLLPAFFTSDGERLRRFEQEARAASALNHPNILTIHEIGQASEQHFIAMEYVNGETLRQRMIRGQMKITEALDIVIQVGSALAAAHVEDIIHRDIKPENIMLRVDGIVKVLDFGLAKLVKREATDLETATRALVNTEPGMIMGTAIYMSPEQARGLEVDARTDIWSLGVVLYEMLCGHAPFAGATTSDVIAAILEREPPLARDLKELPETLEWIVTKALTKEKEERYQTSREMLKDLRRLKQRLEIASEVERAAPPEVGSRPAAAERDRETKKTADKEGAEHTSELVPGQSTASVPSRWDRIKQNRRGGILALVTLVVVVGGIVWGFKLFNQRRAANKAETKSGATASPQVMRTTQITFSAGLDNYPSLSPDGNSIAYSSDHDGKFEIYIKQLTPGGREIQLTSEGQQNLQPAWSPDGQRIAYHSNNHGGIWIVPALGGASRQLTEFGAHPAWSRDGSLIAFQSNAPLELGAVGRNAMPPSTIWMIPSKGGTTKQITQQGTPPGGHGSPSWSPDGKRIVFDASDFLSSTLWSVSLDSSDLKKFQIPDASDAIYSPDGENIYYSLSGLGLWKVRVSPTTGEAVGEPVQVVTAGPARLRHSAISADGKRIAYSLLAISSNLWTVPISQDSNEATGPYVPITRDTSSRNSLPRFSHDGQKIAFTRWRSGTRSDIWVVDSDGKNSVQLTANPTIDSQASWFPKGDVITFLSDRNNNHSVLWTLVLATGKEEILLDLGEGVEFVQLSPDGQQVAINSKKSGTINIWTAPIKGGALKQLTFDNELMGFPCWSPDGKFIAFKIKRGDDSHVGIIPSSGGDPVQLTFDRGESWPHSWSPDGERIAFAGFRDGYWNIWWVSRDGKTQRQVTNYSTLNAFARYPAWSPLGNQIVHESAKTTGNIWMIELK